MPSTIDNVYRQYRKQNQMGAALLVSMKRYDIKLIFLALGSMQLLASVCECGDGGGDDDCGSECKRVQIAIQKWNSLQCNDTISSAIYFLSFPSSNGDAFYSAHYVYRNTSSIHIAVCTLNWPC